MAKKIIAVVVSIFLVLIFRSWIVNYEIIGGDWPYISPEYFLHSTFMPPSWAYFVGNGLGGKIIAYGIDSYLFLTFRISHFVGFSWTLGYKIMWFGAFILMSGLGSYVLSKKIFQKKSFHLLSVLIFTTNTYALMLVGGGQMCVALAYSIAPLVVYAGIRYFEGNNRKAFLLFSLFLGMQMAFDIRIFSVSFVVLLGIFWLYKQGNVAISFSKKIILPLLLSITLNLFWIWPNLLSPSNPLQSLGEAYTSTASLKFFSFATLSNSISLLHPNWPENIFGKIAFQRPEFLLLPLIAFSSLLFANNRKVIIIALIAIVGIFLGKGSNDPFGGVYVFFFEHVPLFQMFRDSTKWYLLISISFSLLIPYVLFRLSGSKLTKKFAWLLPLLFLGIWGFSIREALLGNLSGTFKGHTVPQEYALLREELAKDPTFYRTLWVPRQQRFGYSDFNHPSMEALPLFNATDSASLDVHIKKPAVQEYLKKLSVKYVIVPYDSLGEIFLSDRKYSENERRKFIKILDSIPYLTKVTDNKLTIYRSESYMDMITANGKNLAYKRLSPAKYHIDQLGLGGQEIVMIQNYNPNWVLKNGEETIHPKKSPQGFMAFRVPENYGKLEIVFAEENNYNVGWLLTLFALFVSLLLLLKPTR